MSVGGNASEEEVHAFIYKMLQDIHDTLKLMQEDELPSDFIPIGDTATERIEAEAVVQELTPSLPKVPLKYDSALNNGINTPLSTGGSEQPIPQWKFNLPMTIAVGLTLVMFII